MMFEHFDIYIILLMGVVALLYGAVGHGGASGYLAVMGVWAFPSDYMKAVALVLNIIVSGISFTQYYIKKHFKWDLFYPFAIASIPAAFVGADIYLDPKIYKRLLGVILLLPILKLAGLNLFKSKLTLNFNIYVSILIGAVVGFLSGLLGIGGGILLSPIILLFGWGTAKETAAVSALFIFVNSIAGILNQKSWAMIEKVASTELYIVIGVVVIAGFVGSFIGSTKATEHWIKRLLAIGLSLAAVKLIFL